MQVIAIFDRFGIPCAIGGSHAGVLHSVMRATMDVDIGADMSPKHAAPLAHALGDPCYTDQAAIAEAIRRCA